MWEEECYTKTQVEQAFWNTCQDIRSMGRTKDTIAAALRSLVEAIKQSIRKSESSALTVKRCSGCCCRILSLSYCWDIIRCGSAAAAPLRSVQPLTSATRNIEPFSGRPSPTGCFDLLAQCPA